jgi:hypothetical protein
MTVLRTIPKGDLLLVNRTTSVTTGAGYAAQRIGVSLDVFLGEWFLDQRIGIAYFRDLLIHSPNSDTVRTTFREAIMQTQDVVAVPLMTIELDTTNRVAYVDFVATYANGETISQSLAVTI